MKYIIFLLLGFAPLAALLDLEKGAQDFVLETKKIDIPEYPDAFNPSIISFQDGYLMCFRTGSYQDASDSGSVIHMPVSSHSLRTEHIGLVLLNKDFTIISDTQIADAQDYHGPYSYLQDPRLVIVEDRIYIIYSNILEGLTLPRIRRVFVAELQYDGSTFFVAKPEYLSNYQDNIETRREKNWPPFDYKGRLLIAYSILPHRIFYPLLDGTGTCLTVAETKTSLSWDFGELRGGTPALLENGQYLAFFHSSKKIATTHSEGEKMLHYVMGAYTFSAEPPFALTAVSPEPIVGKNFYEGVIHKTWKPLRVVFPGGFVSDNEFIWVAYGRQDHEIWIAKLDKKGLFASLKQVG